MRKDDVLVAVDGKVIASLPMLQESIKAHASGESLEFDVQRLDGASGSIAVVRK